MNSTNLPAPYVWVCIAPLVEHCSANAKAMGSNPVKVPKYFWVKVSAEYRTHGLCVSAAALSTK